MAHFAKRHYEAIAQVLQDTPDSTEVAVRLADMFEADNSAFDRNRFLYACKKGANVRARTAHLSA